MRIRRSWQLRLRLLAGAVAAVFAVVAATALAVAVWVAFAAARGSAAIARTRDPRRRRASQAGSGQGGSDSQGTENFRQHLKLTFWLRNVGALIRRAQGGGRKRAQEQEYRHKQTDKSPGADQINQEQ
jgi:hypothetical protein